MGRRLPTARSMHWGLQRPGRIMLRAGALMNPGKSQRLKDAVIHSTANNLTKESSLSMSTLPKDKVKKLTQPQDEKVVVVHGTAGCIANPSFHPMSSSSGDNATKPYMPIHNAITHEPSHAHVDNQGHRRAREKTLERGNGASQSHSM